VATSSYRADRIGEFWASPETRTFGELLIDLEEDKYAKAVIWGLLREMERQELASVALRAGRLEL
jgi:hypothetical protein